MPTVDKDIAESLIKKCKTQKNPKIYCIVRYQNRLNGDSEKMIYGSYKICYKPRHYQELIRNDFVGGVDVLWASKRFESDQVKNMDEGELEEYLCSDEFLGKMLKTNVSVNANKDKKHKPRKTVEI